MRETILDAAEALVQQRGFDSVTFQEIADAVGLRKPSLFHHIRNKDELAECLIERCSTKHGAKYEEVVAKNISAPRKLKEVAKIFEDGLMEGRPCLLASIGASRAALSDSAADQLQLAANGAIARFATIFSQGRKESSLTFKGSPENAAMSFVGLLQGLQTLCLLKNDTAAYSRAISTYINSLTHKP